MDGGYDSAETLTSYAEILQKPICAWPDAFVVVAITEILLEFSEKSYEHRCPYAQLLNSRSVDDISYTGLIK
ncbi:MAG: hypothetical protein KBT27_15610 [Prevotellaceae bacterium]|nr:hypothetical protein [Candidatus Faecinaster equi]